MYVPIAQTCMIRPSLWHVKGKAIPLQAWTDPECFRILRLPESKTIGTWKW